MLNIIVRKILGAAFALGLMAGVQFVLTNAAQAQSTVVYLPITSSGSGEVQEVLAAAPNIGPFGGSSVSASSVPVPNDNIDNSITILDEIVAEFTVGTSQHYKRHISVWQKQRTSSGHVLMQGWYVEFECYAWWLSSDCGRTPSELAEYYYNIEVTTGDNGFWGEPFGLDMLPGPSQYLNYVLGHEVEVESDVIRQTVRRISGTYQRTVPISGINVLWSHPHTTGWTKIQ